MPFYLNGVEVRAEFLAEMPLCRGHEVADQPRHMLEKVLMLPPPVRVATCALGNSWRGVRVHVRRPQGLQSICQLANLDHFEAAAAFS